MIREFPERVCRAIHRDKNQPYEKQRERNIYLTKGRLKSWLHDHCMSSKTGIRLGRSRK